MTFTYTPFTSDVSRVRFHIDDTNAAAPVFTDEIITAIITEYGTWQKAVIACIRHIIAKLSSVPDFTADWLKVSTASAIASYRKMLDDKMSELDVSDGSIEASGIHVYRYDSDQLVPPDYQP